MRRRRVGYAGLLVLVGALTALGTGFVHRTGTLDHPGDRAPYLQNDQGTEVTLCWTSEHLETSVVSLRGPDGNEREVGSPLLTSQHEVTVKGLRPGAGYSYRKKGSAPWQAFRTRPARPDSFRFAVFGDIGESPRSASAVEGLLRSLSPDFAVALGDLAYPAGRERLLTERFFTPLSSYASTHVIWHVFGNHDVAVEKGHPLERASEAPNNGPAGLPTDRTYSFDYGNAHFAVVDSNLHVNVTRDVIAPWLEKDLKNSRAPWKFVMLHHPPYSSGKHGSAAKIRKRLVPIFERSGVDAVFAGHDHDYERFAPKNGVTYIVSGTGGARLYRFKGRTEGSLARTDHHHGMTLIEVKGARASLQFVEEDGQALDRAGIPQNP